MGFFKGQGLGACGMPEKDQNDSKLDKKKYIPGML